MKNVFILFLCSAFISLNACTPGNAAVGSNATARDSVLMYKVQGLREFIKVADCWGDDTESYWAYEVADSILNTVDYSRYEDGLARIYAATSYVSYGLSYVPTVFSVARQHQEGTPEQFPKVGLQEAVDITIKECALPEEETLYHVTHLEFRALYSMLYFFKAIDLYAFEERMLHNYERSCIYEELFPRFAPQAAYRVSSVVNMQAWYNYLIICAQMSYWENHGQYPDIEAMPWKELVELAPWHDELTDRLEEIEGMTEEEYHQIELKAAYTQYRILSHIAENLSRIKEKQKLQEQ